MTHDADLLRLELLAIVNRLAPVERQLAEGRPHAASQSVAMARVVAERLAEALAAGSGAPPAAAAPGDHVVVVAAAHAALAARDASGAGVVSREYVWDLSQVGRSSRAGVHGPEAFGELHSEWERAWDEIDSSFEERFLGTDGRVVTLVRQAGSLWGSHAPPSESTYAIVSSVETGALARDEVFGSWRDALGAVGGAAAPSLQLVS